MIQSMTGYGKAVREFPSRKITVEIKSLNSKNLDINTRVSSMYREKELDIRKLIANRLKRGKVDFALYMEITGESATSHINVGVVKQYMEQLKVISDVDEDDLLTIAMRLPDVVSTEREEIDETEWHIILEAINEALDAVLAFRTQEGDVLEQDFALRVDNLKTLLQEVKALDPERVLIVRERLERGIADIREKVDVNRFEQELIYYIEKFDITEEKVRLENHLSYFIKSLNSKDSNGKKLGFICQELGREINTIGSKANHAPMQKVVVQMKDELEKIKEQLLNVL